MKIKFVAVFSALILCMSAQGGTRDGGGGVGVRCPLQNGGTTIELLDIHEGTLRGLGFPYSPQSDSDISDFSAKAIASQFWNPWSSPMAEYISGLKTQLFDGILNGSGFKNFETGKYVLITYTDSLPLSKDIGRYDIRQGCSLEQVAYFDDERSTLFIARPAWNELSGFSKAALMIHELIYAENRLDGLEYAGTSQAGPISSERSRQFVSSMLSIQGLKPKAYGVPVTNTMRCFDQQSDEHHQTSYFIYDSAPNEVTFVLMLTDGLFSPYSATARIVGITTQDLVQPGMKSLTERATVVFDGELDAPNFHFDLTMLPNQNPQVVISRDLGGSQYQVGRRQNLSCRIDSGSSSSPVVGTPVKEPKP